MPLPVMLNLYANLLLPFASVPAFESTFEALLFAYCPLFLFTCLGIYLDDVILELESPYLYVFPCFLLLSSIESLDFPLSSTSRIALQIEENMFYECTILFIPTDTNIIQILIKVMRVHLPWAILLKSFSLSIGIKISLPYIDRYSSNRS